MAKTLIERYIESRKNLGKLLTEILGSNNVYFQPPESMKLKYPCIIYTRNKIITTPADNLAYKTDFSYTITLVDTDPDSPINIKLIAAGCKFDRPFKTTGLYHTVYTITY